MEGQKISASSFCFFKNLMQPGCADYPVDSICDGCRYHEQDWQYRFCRFTECPGIPGFKTYREEYGGEDRDYGGIQG